MKKFTQHYLIAALWSSIDDKGEPLDHNYNINDLGCGVLEKAELDCEMFIAKAGDLLDSLDMSHVAHDFWLTRNGHGAGFWDGDYEKKLGEKLTDLAHSFGEITIYNGDDNKLYFM